jgi:replication factor C subunit 2/4
MLNENIPYFKIIILDEADAMTKEAQSALRKVMEETSHITRFCFICNYINQIIEPINSRCVKIRFKPIKIENIILKLENISMKEDININNECLNCIAEISNGDLRKSILILQNITYFKKNLHIKDITIKEIYEICNYISDEELKLAKQIAGEDSVLRAVIKPPPNSKKLLVMLVCNIIKYQYFFIKYHKHY